MQFDLFPETKQQGYIDVDFCDLSEPSFRITEATSFYAKKAADRIEFLSNLPKEKYYIFRHERGDPSGLPFIVNNITGRKYTTVTTRNFYPSVQIEGRYLYMHTIVGLYFLTNDMPNVKTVIDHLDEDTYNYRPENLQWLSHSENIKRRNA